MLFCIRDIAHIYQNMYPAVYPVVNQIIQAPDYGSICESSKSVPPGCDDAAEVKPPPYCAHENEISITASKVRYLNTLTAHADLSD